MTVCYQVQFLLGLAFMMFFLWVLIAVLFIFWWRDYQELREYRRAEERKQKQIEDNLASISSFMKDYSISKDRSHK